MTDARSAARRLHWLLMLALVLSGFTAPAIHAAEAQAGGEEHVAARNVRANRHR